MSSEMGRRLKVEVFGESHGPGIGMVADGFPAGEEVDSDELMRFMGRRRPGKALSTARREEDAPRFVSGVYEGKTTGFPVCAFIGNSDAHSRDYRALRYTPRPAHADYTAWVRYGGYADMRGGGHFSGRLTAPLCVAGGMALQILARRGVYVGAHLVRVGQASAPLWPVEIDKAMLAGAADLDLPADDVQAAEAMRAQIEQARDCGDSVGGVVECAAIGVPEGLGDPLFDGVENRLASALFGIPAVKGVEFGAGFAAAQMRGSQCNDPFAYAADGSVRTTSNNAGGCLGGITTGMPVVVRCAFKPTPSIAREQQTVDLQDMRETTISIQGRHDPCIAVRAVPVVEAVMALVVLDMMLEGGEHGTV